jgi:signal transduction histidine kinase
MGIACLFSERLRRYGLIAAACLCGVGLRAGVAITGVTVDGKDVPREGLKDPAGGGLQPLRVRESAREVVFRFAEEPAVQAPAARLRYKLEGYDTHWIDRPITMRLLLHFYDEKREIVGQNEFFLEGETPVWRCNVDTSDYVSRREQVVVPDRATGVKLAFVSHGGNEGVGLIGIDAVRVTIERTGEARPSVFDLSIKGADVARPNGSPVNWMREGSSLSIAQLGIRSQPSPHPVLVLDDENNLNYGNWSLDLAKELTLKPGDLLTVEWQTAHSIGGSGPGVARYSSLKPGVYTFRVAGFRSNGEATGMECALPLVIVPAIYRRTEFWLVLLAFVAVIAALTGRAVEVGRARRRVAAMERERVLERERTRIARDLHDEMGAGLSAIAMQSDWIRRECGGTASPETRHRIETVCQSAVELVRSVDEIVWAVNPSNDTVERFVNYLTQYTEQYLDAAGLRFRFDIPRDLPGAVLAGSMRHNLFLAVKEALRNAVKHAKAELLWLRVSVEGGELAITVEDNGKGFDPGRLASDGSHNGVGNMRRRMEEVAGRFEESSQPGSGTRVTFAVPLGGGEAVGSGQ